MNPPRWLSTLVLLAGLSSHGCSDEPPDSGVATDEARVRVAVAANFASTANRLVEAYEKETAIRVELISGATGKHYAQIAQGAPFDLFLAADSLRPFRLEEEGIAIPDSRWTYAYGKLAVWARSGDPQSRLQSGGGRVALANPRLAPYGVAAEALLAHMEASYPLSARPTLIRGENVAQAFQFGVTGHVDVALVSLAQTQEYGSDSQQVWTVPDSLYPEIVQQGVLMSSRREVVAFREFLGSTMAQTIIRDAGYRVTSGP